MLLVQRVIGSGSHGHMPHLEEIRMSATPSNTQPWLQVGLACLSLIGVSAALFAIEVLTIDKHGFHPYWGIAAQALGCGAIIGSLRRASSRWRPLHIVCALLAAGALLVEVSAFLHMLR
jgi:hypothetical protein